MTALLAGVIVACAAWIGGVVGYDMGRRGERWRRDCDDMTERIRQACGYYDMFPVDWDARAEELFRQWDAEDADPDRCDTECVWTYRRLMERTRPVWRRDD